MSNTITIGINKEDQKYLDENPLISPTQLFRDALFFKKRLNSISETDEIRSFSEVLAFIEQLKNNILRLQKVVLIKGEAFEKLNDVVQIKQAGTLN